MSFFNELKRRNVFKVAIAYVVVAWLLLQVSDTLVPALHLPEWFNSGVAFVLIIGFPIAVLFAWAFEMTPEGLKREHEVDRSQSITPHTGRKLNNLIFAVMALALGYFAYDKFVLSGSRDAALVEAAMQAASEKAVTEAAPAESDNSIAVLPFVDLSQAKDQEYLGDGLAEEILNHLAQVPALRVVGRTSSFSFKGKDDDLGTIGGKLGVVHVLEGSVRKSGDRIRISAQLVAASDGSQLWSRSYDRNLTDVFAVQDEIARDVAQALSVKLDAVNLNTAQGGTTNVDAYDRYLRWRQLLFSENYDEEHDRQRVRLAREAVALDPAFVLGWDALATSLNLLANEVNDEQAERLRAEAAQVRAHIVGLAPDHWIVKRERAYALWAEGKWAEAIALTREVMEGGPVSYERAYPYSELIFSVGYLDETVAVVERLKTIEPLAMYISRDLQYDYSAARRIDDAETEYQRSLSLDGNDTEPTALAFHRMLARPDADPKVLRDLHGRLIKALDYPFLLDLGGALDDREAMLSILREAATDPAYGGDRKGIVLQMETADALGDADLAADALRRYLESSKGFADGSMHHRHYWQFWTTPHSKLRAHPEFKRWLLQTGVADYWRQSGRWGDGCKPVGADDFQCE